MSGYEEVREPTAVAMYSGVPNESHSAAEKGRWRRFLEWAMPWLKQKWEMGEEVLAARLAQEKAKARQMDAEASQAEVKVAQDMLRTIQMARELEQQKLADVPAFQATQAELEEGLRAILAKVAVLRWQHGTRIEFRQSSEDEPKVGADVPSPPGAGAVKGQASGGSPVGGGDI
jgi:hypothetical protein